MEQSNLSLIGTIYAPPAARAPWQLEDLLPGSTLRYFSYGRRALAAGLRAAGIGAGSAVLLPEFICRDLLSSVAAVGARTELYPVDVRLSPAREPEDWPAGAAVVAVNYFGFPQDLEPFRRYCRVKNAVLIEDNAHGLFSRDSSGRLLGSRADMGVFSLRKTLPLFNGAALALTGQNREWRIAPQESWGGAQDLRYSLKSVVRQMVRRAGPRPAFSLLSLIRRLRAARSNNGIPDATLTESVLPEPAAASRRLSLPLLEADPKEESSRRRALYALMARTLTARGFEPVFASLPEGVVPYAYPFRLPERRKPEALRLLAELSLRPLPWPDLPSSIEAHSPAHYRDVSLVHFLW